MEISLSLLASQTLGIILAVLIYMQKYKKGILDNDHNSTFWVKSDD